MDMESVMLAVQVEYHVTCNIYPPQSRRLVPTALEAINNMRSGVMDADIAFDGFTVNGADHMTTAQVVEWLHLEGFNDVDD